MDSDNAWRHFGQSDPYFGVLTSPDFKADRMSDEARARFFDSGRRYIELVLEVIHKHLDPSFRPSRALDFGCGVGRLALPLAHACESVVGVDVSESMLEHARSNARMEGRTNVEFVRSDDALSSVRGTFDLLNSFIVFQHIPPPRGEAFLKAMLGRLREGGVGALHFTYSYESSVPRFRQLLTEAYLRIPFAWNARNLLKGRPVGEPMMQMNEYSLNRIFRILQEDGCHSIHCRFTETGSFGYPFYGVIIFFQKKQLPTTEHA